jgi:hypothetical protein
MVLAKGPGVNVTLFGTAGWSTGIALALFALLGGVLGFLVAPEVG